MTKPYEPVARHGDQVIAQELIRCLSAIKRGVRRDVAVARAQGAIEVAFRYLDVSSGRYEEAHTTLAEFSKEAA